MVCLKMPKKYSYIPRDINIAMLSQGFSEYPYINNEWENTVNAAYIMRNP
jgi:hypothetical protein